MQSLSTHTEYDLHEIVEALRKDPSTIANLDFEAIYSLCENTDIIENKTTKQIANEKYDAFARITTDHSHILKFYTSLTDYFLVDEIHKLKSGSFIRYIKLNTTDPKKEPKLEKGGIVVNVLFKQTGVYVLFRCTYNQKFIQIKYDDHLIFQKLGTDELLVLMANDHLEKMGK